jgi:autotransporter-associated beta strand protein
MATSSQVQAQSIFTPTTVGTYNWDNTSNWQNGNAPTSSASTALVFGNGARLAGGTVTAHNNIGGLAPFKLNSLQMTYAAPDNGSAAVTITGNQLDFNSNGGATPTLVFNTTGNVKPVGTIMNAIKFTDTTAITSTTEGILMGTLSGTGFNKSGAGLLRLQASANFTGPVGVSEGTLSVGYNGNAGNLGSVSVNLSGSGSFTVNKAGSMDLNNKIEGSTTGSVNFHSSSNAILTIKQKNTYSAATSITAFQSNAVGTVKLGIDHGLSNTTALTIGNNGASVQTFDLNGRNQEIGSLATTTGGSTTNSIVTNSVGGDVKTLKITNPAGTTSTTYSGLISGNLALTKSGDGTQILTQATTYTGDTIVEQGTLALSGAGSINSSALTVGSGATFRNTGVAYANALKVAEGALFTGTTSAFTPTSLTLSGDLTDNAFTSVNFGSSLTKAGQLTVNLANIAAGDYTLISSSTSGMFTSVTVAGTSLASNDDNASFAGDSGTLRYTYSNVNNLLKIENLSAIPEPSTYAALAGLAILGFALRRRSKA